MTFSIAISKRDVKKKIEKKKQNKIKSHKNIFIAHVYGIEKEKNLSLLDTNEHIKSKDISVHVQAVSSYLDVFFYFFLFFYRINYHLCVRSRK